MQEPLPIRRLAVMQQSNLLCRRPQEALSTSRVSGPRFETLERRTLNDAANPTPGDGNDYYFVAATDDSPLDNQKAIVEPAQVEDPTPVFQYVDATFNQKMVPVSSGRVKRIMVDGYTMHPTDSSGNITTRYAVSEANARAGARLWAQHGYDTVVIDIESFQLDTRRYGTAAVAQARDMYVNVIRWMHDEVPSLTIGAYGILPVPDMYAATAIGKFQDIAHEKGGWFADQLQLNMATYAKWQAANEFLRPIAEELDFVCPTLYTQTEDEGWWSEYARSLIGEARRFGKPVVPFVAPLYHDAMPAEYAFKPVPQDVLRRQLDVIRQEADGVAMWYGTDYSTNINWSQTYLDHAADNASSSGWLDAAAPMPLFAAQPLDTQWSDDDQSTLAASIIA